MISIANSLISSGGDGPIFWNMTVLQLAIFLCVHRAGAPLGLNDVCAVLGRWFDRPISLEDIGDPVAEMVRRGWLVAERGMLRATRDGRAAARPLLHGLIGMIDQGTRLIDVALLMSLLRLAKEELDDDHGAA